MGPYTDKHIEYIKWALSVWILTLWVGM